MLGLATTSSSVPSQGVSPEFLQVSGRSFTLRGQSWPLFGAAHPVWESDAPTTISLAQAAGINMLRLTNWLDEGNVSITAGGTDSTRWANLDVYVEACRAAGIRVMLDFSTFANLVHNNGFATSWDWGSFLSFVANRRNTVNGRRYSLDPTIAIIALSGEINPPGSYSFTANNGQTVNLNYTTADLNTFYNRTCAQSRYYFPSQITETGGFLHLDVNAGIDWQTIMGDPHNQVGSIHVYSSGDANTTVPNVSSYCAGLNKPWIIEEFGYDQTDGDSSRATNYQSRIDLGNNNGASGILFWALGPQVVGVGGITHTYDVNTDASVVLCWAKVLANIVPCYSSEVLSENQVIAYYRLENPAVIDVAGGYTGAWSSAGASTASGLLSADGNGATSLNGSSGYVQLPANLDPCAGRSSFSAELWFKLNATPGGNPRLLANAHTDGDNLGLQIWLTGATHIDGAVGLGNAYASAGANFTFTVGSTYHMVLTYDGSVPRLYVNGSLIATGGSNPGRIARASFPVNLGRNPAYNGDYANAVIDEVAFYGVALPAARITAHYQAGTRLPHLFNAG